LLIAAYKRKISYADFIVIILGLMTALPFMYFVDES
jgi:hypothetical protein